MKKYLFLFISLFFISSSAQAGWIGSCFGLGGAATIGLAAASGNLQTGEKISTEGYAASFVAGCIGGIVTDYSTDDEIRTRVLTKYQKQRRDYEVSSAVNFKALCRLRDDCPKGGMAYIEEDEGQIQDIGGTVTFSRKAIIRANNGE